MKTYRTMSNLFKSCIDKEIVENPLLEKSDRLDFILSMLYDRMNWTDNVYKNRAHTNEIKRLIGDELFYKLLTMVQECVYNESNNRIEYKLKSMYLPHKSFIYNNAYCFNVLYPEYVNVKENIPKNVLKYS